jgi:RHS repeat-associated protein
MRFAAVPAREPALGDLSYDRASNLASWKVQSGTSATAVTAKHDAWNRLTEVSFGGTLRCRQAHNALHWRSFQLSDRTGTGSGAGAGPDGTMDQARLMSYGADWRLLEERVDDNLSLSAWTEGTWSPGTALDRVQQYVWGTRYVDDIVLHRVDRNMDGDYSDPGDGTWHHLTDAQFSSVSLVTDAGILAERVAYSAYGTARQLWREDINADGAVDSADLALLLAAFGSGVGGTQYRSEIDLNRDGVINIMDLGLLLGGYAPALAPGTLSSALVDNPIGWDGYVFDRESGLYTVRFRTYETGLGRWIERDPLGLMAHVISRAIEAASDPLSVHALSHMAFAFNYAVSSPGNYRDPTGLIADCSCGPDVSDWLAEELRIVGRWAQDALTEIDDAWPIGLDVSYWYSGRFSARVAIIKQMAPQLTYFPDTEFRAGDCPSAEACNNTVTVCGMCMHSSEVGNMVYGYMARTLDFSWTITKAGAWYGNRGIQTAEDKASVKAGFGIFSAGLCGYFAKHPGVCRDIVKGSSPLCKPCATSVDPGKNHIVLPKISRENIWSRESSIPLKTLPPLEIPSCVE